MNRRNLLKGAAGAVALLGVGAFDAEATERSWDASPAPLPSAPIMWGRVTYALAREDRVAWLLTQPDLMSYPFAPVVLPPGAVTAGPYDTIWFVDLDPLLGPPGDGYRRQAGVSWDVALREGSSVAPSVAKRDLLEEMRRLDMDYARWVHDGVTSPYRVGAEPMPPLRFDWPAIKGRA